MYCDYFRTNELIDIIIMDVTDTDISAIFLVCRFIGIGDIKSSNISTTIDFNRIEKRLIGLLNMTLHSESVEDTATPTTSKSSDKSTRTGLWNVCKKN